MGNLQWSYLHNLLRQWIGDDGRIERIDCQFRTPNLKGQTVTAQGRVKEVRVEGERRVIDLDVWTANQDGAVLAPGTATVSVPAAPSA
jgi:acyl dehydratase